MNRYAEFELDRLCTRLYLDGACTVRWDDVYLWYGAERLSKNTYRDIRSRWIATCEEQGYSQKEIPAVTLFKGSNSMTLIRDAFEDEEFLDLNSFAL